MAHFYGVVSNGKATKSGTKATGLSTHVRGWNVGARVELRHEDDTDVVYVWATRGSNGLGNDVLIARYTAGTTHRDIRTGQKVEL